MKSPPVRDLPVRLTMEIFRLDTGEKVDFRPLTREERQQQIEWDGGGEKH